MSIKKNALSPLKQLKIIYAQREAYLRELDIQKINLSIIWIEKMLDFINQHFYEDYCTVQYIKKNLAYIIIIFHVNLNIMSRWE